VAEYAARELDAAPIDVAFVGIGENSHLAFNDRLPLRDRIPRAIT
jgi:6-phosphogluconolactonase/glucosamine-6-phosphate isomerase/deaminase